MKMRIKKYVDDTTLTWEERYKRLEAHHLEETKELIQTIKDLEEKLYIAYMQLGEYESQS